LKSSTVRRFAPATAALALFAFFATLYLSGWHWAYARGLMSWGMWPWDWPFLDTDTVLSAVRCLRQGVDAYAANPCDPLERAFDYSPLWMVLTVFPVTTAWIPWIGLVVFALFLLGLTLLPPGRTTDASVLIVLGTLSTAVVFGVERGNNDLVIFCLTASMASFLARDPSRRLPGYALGLLAGLLKYYPLLAMASALRERPARFAALAVGSLVVTVLFVAVTWHDLTRALAIIPTGSPYYEMFGAVNLGLGISVLFDLPAWFTPLVRIVLTIGAVGAGVALGLRRDSIDALAKLDARESAFLLVGALMVLGCFLSAQNIYYRCLNLLLILPSLTALRLVDAPRRFKSAAFVALGLLWHQLYFRWIQVLASQFTDAWKVPVEMGLGWLPRELAWWWLVTLMVSCVTVLLRDSPVTALLVSLRQNQSPA
jgi:hypothetical protein